MKNDNKPEQNVYDFLKKAKFSCQQCSDCCRLEPGAVFLTEEDALKLSKHLSMDLEDFIEQHCRTINKSGKTVVSLKEKVNYDCIFWNKGCLVYEARPLQCRTYPFWPFIVESEEAWNEESKRCKGMNVKGSLTYEEKVKFYESEENVEYLQRKNTKNDDEIRVFFPI